MNVPVTRGLFFIIAAVVCFAIALILLLTATGADTQTIEGFTLGGLLAFALAHV